MNAFYPLLGAAIALLLLLQTIRLMHLRRAVQVFFDHIDAQSPGAITFAAEVALRREADCEHNDLKGHGEL